MSHGITADSQRHRVGPELRKLGEVERILRLGPLHGVDDRYDADHFAAERWAPGESNSHPVPKVEQTFDAYTPLTFPDAGIFVFEGSRQAEGALLVRKAYPGD